MDNQKLLAILRTAQRDHDTTGFNEFDFIHAFGSGREALLYARLFWPQFVEYKDMVFLSSTAGDPEDKRRIDEALRSYGGDRVKTEESFNVVEIPILFGRRIAETNEEEDRLLAELIMEAWHGRLRFLHPNRDFQTRILEPDDTGGEIAVLFSQKPKTDQ